GPAGPVLSRLTRDIYSFVQEGRLAALTLYIERNDISVNFKGQFWQDPFALCGSK
ncbi:hypothetical protein MKX03_016808, partial [Papaver bracteatum]